MASVHFLNVAPGDCTIIRHVSGRVSMIDICDGNIKEEPRKAILEKAALRRLLGNFRMCKYPTNPILYAKSLGITRIFRFILTHPDMDHMDGLDVLADEIGITNFWHTGVQREAPDFSSCPYNEADWNRYESLRDGRESGVNTLKHLAGVYFQFANRIENAEGGGDGLYILAPDDALVAAASDDGDINDGSYVLLYRSAGGRVLIPGDAHDATWEYVLKHYESDVANCSVMIAPHHGRGSDRSFDFLDQIRPKLTLFGCAPSEHLAYDAWSQRKLAVITSNQAGNIVLEVADQALDVYVENAVFAEVCKADCLKTNAQGYIYLRRINNTAE
ncbi:MAG: MBL fold metallo-hydrolase [Nitrospirae bacterium]|nr:MBL fold metallo-hydrolase [Candidatus Manganitrophaceae bacterium]